MQADDAVQACNAARVSELCAQSMACTMACVGRGKHHSLPGEEVAAGAQQPMRVAARGLPVAALGGHLPHCGEHVGRRCDGLCVLAAKVGHPAGILEPQPTITRQFGSGLEQLEVVSNKSSQQAGFRSATMQARDCRALCIVDNRKSKMPYLICSTRSPLTSHRLKVSGCMCSPSPHQCT